ncbi:MAG: hypothetical protein HYZ79_07320 [Candidatus Melainabacteria bacterium]|nr:hypothetical protein [Candidatus Melainabacteria bacterium]
MTIDSKKSIVRKSLFANNIIAGALILLYVGVYGVSSQLIMTGVNLMFFISSLIYALGVMYVRDPGVQALKLKQGIVYSQVVGTVLIAIYALVFGISSVVLFNGFQLVFFMTSYIFALSYFYLRDPKRLEKQEEISYSVTPSVKFPCHINKDDMTVLVKDLNNPLCLIVGFTELLLNREFTSNEKEYMLRNIYQSAISMKFNIDKTAQLMTDTPTKPNDLHAIVDMLADSNFK